MDEYVLNSVAVQVPCQFSASANQGSGLPRSAGFALV
jgi:hypothetical protein